MKMYEELADWWPLLSAPADYAEEASFYASALLEAAGGPIGTLLELGSGGGNNASHMKAHFKMTLVDKSPGMLAVSRALNPDCEHAEGDMRSVRLGREFDAVFIHDAIVYMTTEADLQAAIETAFVHTRPGGVALFAPDHVKETFAVETDFGGHDGASRSLRYLEWSWDPDPGDTTYIVDYFIALRDRDGKLQVEHDRQIEGVFPRKHWLKAVGDAGFKASRVRFKHSEVARELELFVGKRPAGTPARRPASRRTS
jgi:hypothetical protein